MKERLDQLEMANKTVGPAIKDFEPAFGTGLVRRIPTIGATRFSGSPVPRRWA
jgi:hypothetical protein